MAGPSDWDVATLAAKLAAGTRPAVRRRTPPRAKGPTTLPEPSADRSSDTAAMAPQLAYGRHRGPARDRCRHAAVAITFYRRPATGWTIPLTRRPTTMRHHGGQICFPGGRLHPGETATQAACREFQEELGLPAKVICEIGQLPSLYVYASDHLVAPVVMILEIPDEPWQPDPAEVDEVIDLPVEAITESAQIVRSIRRTRLTGGDGKSREDRRPLEIRFHAPAYAWESHRIWGATAILLDHLARTLRR